MQLSCCMGLYSVMISNSLYNCSQSHRVAIGGFGVTAGAVKPVRNDILKSIWGQVPLQQSAVGHCSFDVIWTPSMPFPAIAVTLLRLTHLLLRRRDQTGHDGQAGSCQNGQTSLGSTKDRQRPILATPPSRCNCCTANQGPILHRSLSIIRACIQKLSEGGYERRKVPIGTASWHATRAGTFLIVKPPSAHFE